ncbi:MAG: organic solvent tolerance protein OstA, partial [Bacteroidales bacterium]|nr:organic solvent tolerance protein OstA [Bacteroidales bacterium]
ALDAYNNIYVTQGDTLHLYGEYLHYDGNTKLAQIRRNVKLINKDLTLTNDALDYNIKSGVGYYTNYALITSEENTLESTEGYYYSKTNWMHFRDSVVIINPDYKILCDTLHYETKLKVAHFFGPTEIIGDSNYIYCERGWYDTDNDIGELRINAFVENKEQTLEADSIYYDRNTGLGIARRNVILTDKEQNAVLTGEKGNYYEFTEYAVMTDSAVFIQITDEDSLFVHADTLKSYPDSTGEKVIQAYYGVRLFKSDMQARCDSMIYAFIDSTAHLFVEPILWAQNYQLTANHIRVLNKNKQLDKMYLDKDAMIVNRVDSTKYNQIKGKNMICHFIDNKLNKIDVNGNGQTVYYPIDDSSGDFIGVNKLDCSNMIIYMKDGQLNSIHFFVDPTAIMYPLEDAPKNELQLRGFAWRSDVRPKSKMDIFK